MAELWRRFRASSRWVQVPVGIVAGLFALGIVMAPFTDPDEGNDVATGPVRSEATATAPTTTTSTRPAGTSTTTTTAVVPGLPAGEDTVVTRVTDGDSLVVTDGTRIRLIGIDTPEVESDDCFSAEATEHTRSLVGPGTRVRLVYDVGRLDVYERTLAYVYRLPDGLFVNLALARDGYARQLTVPPNVRHADELGAAVAEARRADRGLWSSCGATVTTRAPTPAPRLPAPEPGGGEGTPPADEVVPDEPAPKVPEPAPEEPVASGDCHPSYEGACVPFASDVDCGGGGGNGPEFVYEKDILVVGDDVYGLDSDNDGIGCES